MARGETARAASTNAGPCDDSPDVQCGTVDVPRDRSHPSLGTIPIAYRLYPHTDTSKPGLDPIFATEGGPGYSITQNNASAYAEFVFAPLRDRHDLVMIDQRGVGLSNAIDCSPLQHRVANGDVYSAVSACAAFLGPSADEYGTGDDALDVDAVRKALGVNRFMYYGASYSGVDVQAYAARSRPGCRPWCSTRRRRSWTSTRSSRPAPPRWRARSTSCAPARRAARRITGARATTSHDRPAHAAGVADLAPCGAGKHQSRDRRSALHSPSTVEYHLRKAFRKLDVKSRTQLARRLL